jgi:hypothetical protein
VGVVHNGRVDDVDGDVSQSFWCRDERHTTCIHVLDAVERWPRPYQVTEDLALAALCSCTCHLDCPLADRESAADWPDACQCPATLRLLKRHSAETSAGLDLAQFVRTSVDQSRRKARARQEFRRRAHGLARDEVEELLDQIWPEHGLPVPPAHARPALVEWAMGLTSRLDEARTTLDVLEGTGRLIGSIVKMFRNEGQENEPSPYDDATDYAIETGRDSVEVVLDADAQPRLTAMTDDAAFASLTVTSATVVLRDGLDGSIEVWERTPASSASLAPLGLIPPAQAVSYRQPLAAAKRVGQIAVCRAVRMGTRYGGWRLYVNLPLARDDVGRDRPPTDGDA